MCRPFRARHIDSDEYLRWVVSYIHLNPVDKIEPKWKENGIKSIAKTRDFLQKYTYSSYQDYYSSGKRGSLATRPESAILNKEALPIDISEVDDLKDMFKEYAKQEYLADDM